VHVPDSFDLRDAMRGEDQRSEVLFSYVRLESRIPADHPLRAIRTLIDEALNGLSARLQQALRARRTAVDPAGAAVAGAAAASVLHGALGAAVDGANSTTIYCSGGSSGSRG